MLAARVQGYTEKLVLEGARVMQADPVAYEAVFRFGPFELVPLRRFLSRDGHAIRVGSRALDLLVVLVENAGKIVDKGAMLARVWPNVVVEDGNVRVHIRNLRRLLGDDGLESRYIVHVARRGYVFVAPIHEVSRNLTSGSATMAPGIR
jgi:DNA-binding winged helix-turn-helix (wHTH) protein